VQGGQYSGYLWPMGPFFAVGHVLGLPDWVTERIWLGTLLGLAAYGAIKLVDTWLERHRGVPHLVAGALYMLNPYVVVFTSRTTVFLLAYVALPWLLLITHCGLRDPRRWWWPAAFALVTTSTAGGVNATVTAFILLGPILLVLFELLTSAMPPRAAFAFAWRCAVATVAASLWWVLPLLVQSRYGLNFLQFTEQVGAIWATTSLTESLRLMGYWPSYLGIGYADHLTPFFADSGTLLFNPAVVVATLLIPALALTGYLRSRRWRYAPFLLGSALIGLLAMSVDYPDGTPGRKAVTFVYNHVSALQFLRTTYKAGPVLAVAVALLAGAGAQALWRRGRKPAVRATGAATALALVVLGALPFFEGRALELTWKSIPAAWQAAARDLDSKLPPNSRAVVLPGQVFAFYKWGATVDPILPALTNRPVAIRNTPPYDDLHAVDYLWTVDGLVQQQRVLPGQLPPLLDLMSARAVLTGTDDDAAVSGAIAPAKAAGELRTQPGFARPSRTYGDDEVRRYDTPARGLVRIEPATRPTVLDGSAQGIADVAALGALPRSAPLFYAADLSPAAIRRDAAAGATVFITDSNRRRVFVASRVRQDVGWTVPASEPFSADAAVLDPFARAGAAAQTVAVFTGVRSITAPYNPELAEFPEHRPFAAFDGDPSTSWQADPTLDVSRRWIEVGFDRPRAVSYVDVLPDQSDPVARVTRLTVAGTTFAIHPGWNHLRLNLHRARSLRFLIADLSTPHTNTGYAGGLAEVRIPGVTATEALRAPVLAETALRGADLSHSSLNYVFERTTADVPLARGPAPAQVTAHGDRLESEAALVRQAQDPETGIARTIDPPARRWWTLAGLATISPTAPDAALDRLAGTQTAGALFASSGRLDGRPAYRASAAFDGSPATAWAAPYGRGQPAWLAWRTNAPRTLRRLTLGRSDLPAQFPSLVSIAPDGGPSVTAPVKAGGQLTLPRPLTSRGFTLKILRASGSSRPAVAVGDVHGAGIPAVRQPNSANVAGRCGDLSARIGARTVPLRIQRPTATFDEGEPVRMASCGPPFSLTANSQDLVIRAGTLRPLLAELSSRAPVPQATTAAATGAIPDAGRQTPGSYTGIRATVSAPSWLVLGESYNRGWRAQCDGRSLGPPHAIDGFANGWLLDRSCRTASITFAPQRTVDAGYLAGGAACAVLLLILVLRRPRRPSQTPPNSSPLDNHKNRWTPAKAAAAGLAAALLFGFLFGLRAGAVIGPAFALILWRGVATKTLIKTAGALLVVVVPLLYLLFPGQNQGGWDVDYAAEHLGAHWVAVGAFALLALALARDLSTATGLRRGARAPAPPL
jgi:hypothetical protein